MAACSWMAWVLLARAAFAADFEHIQGEFHVEEYAADACIASTNPPKKPLPLEFCHWYNGDSCCIPASDLENYDQFNNLMDLGLSCSYSKHAIRTIYSKIREWYCMSCDPDEPRYRFLAEEGSPLNGIAPLANRSSSDPFYRWRVCKSFADALWNGEDPEERAAGRQYDQCGIKVENPCDGGKQVVWDPERKKVVETSVSVLQGWDPYQCGDNILVPSKYFKGENAAEDFLRFLQPPNFGDANFDFVLVDDTVTDDDCTGCASDATNKRCTGCPSGCVFFEDRCIGFRHDATPCFRNASAAPGPTVAAVFAALLTFLLVFS